MTIKHTFFIALVLLIISLCGFANESNQKALADSAYFVGTKQFSWEDAGRLDDYYGGTRKINVQVWYPCDSIGAASARTPYLLFGYKLANKLQGWAEHDFRAVQNIKTTSFVEARMSATLNGAPLLIFSPSLGGNLSYYTYYAEYFAKRGYIIMGINHLHESEVVVVNDSIYPGNFQFHDSLKALKIPEEISAENYREAMGARQKILAEDLLFALTQLIADSSIGSKIDQSRIGVFGHSIGGAAAIFSSILDKRIKAVIDLDGTPPSVALKYGIDVPFLFIEDLTDYTNHQGYAKLHKRRSDFCELNRADSWRVLIKGFNHNSFLDINYYLAENSEKAHSEKANLDLIIGYMNEFLDHYLLGYSELNLADIKSERIEIIRFEK